MPTTNYEKMQVSDLKSRLKLLGMSHNGDKGTLIFRLKLYERCETKGIVWKKPDCERGINPCLLKIGDLKVAASSYGVSPFGTPDEILIGLVEALDKNKVVGSDGEFGTNPKDSNVSGVAQSKTEPYDTVAIARRVLDLNEVDDYEGILNIAATTERITRHSSVATMRKAYLKLSLIIHPDKLGRTFEHSTKAFQALVTAFDRLSSPTLPTEAEIVGKGQKARAVATISRSNEGCYRTRVLCPRCKQPWNEGTLDGNPDYCYNFLMMGLKCYTCSTCLFEFGCMTAIHKCPYCNGCFEYAPQDYHRKIICSRSSCKRPFGFFLYNCSERMMNTIRKEVREEQERRLKARESKSRRAARVSGRGNVDEEKAFMLGLSDCCPRCGEVPDGSSESDFILHLMECNDTKGKHAAYARKKARTAEKLEERQRKQDSQEDVQATAVWQFLGAETSQLWLLNEDQLRKHAKGADLDTSGDKNDLISRIAAHKARASSNIPALPSSSSALLSSTSRQENDVSKDTSSSLVIMRQEQQVVAAAKKKKLSPEDLPSNFQSLSSEQLRSVCAANGLLHRIPKDSSKKDILRVIERELYGDDVVGLVSSIAGKKKRKSCGVDSVYRDNNDEDSGDSDLGSDEEYQPDSGENDL